MSDIVYKTLASKVEKIAAQTPEAKAFRFVGSTPDPDRAGDIIDLDGWQLENWQKNPVILWGHSYREPPIGRGMQVVKDSARKALVFDIEFAPKSVHPFAGLIADLTEAGFIRAVSVGFQPVEHAVMGDDWWDPVHYMKQDLLELSIVNVPMNPQALLVTNSVQRHLMETKGMRFSDRASNPSFEGNSVVQINFSAEVFKSFTDVEAWQKEHEYHGNYEVVPGGWVLNCINPKNYDKDSTRSFELSKGVRVVVAKQVRQHEENNSDDPLEKILAAFSTKATECFENQTKALEQITLTVKSLAHLIEIDGSDDPASSSGKTPESLAQRYLQDMSTSMKDVFATILKKD